MIPDPRTFLDTVAQNTNSADPVKGNRLATIDPAYTTGKPRVRFDGTTTLSADGFVILPGYTPAAGDRVLMHPAGNTYVIGGKVTDTPIPGGVTDHSQLTGLANDDHPQYLNNARGDARYGLGPIAIYQRLTSSAGATTLAGVRVCYTFCNLLAGRLYKVSAPSLGIWSTEPAFAEVLIRFTTNNTIPGTASTVLIQNGVNIGISGGFVHGTDLTGFFRPTVNVTGFVPGIFVGRVSGTQSVQSFGGTNWPATIMVEDLGTDIVAAGGE